MERLDIPPEEDIALVFSYCSKILDGYEIMERKEESQNNINSIKISHGICPDCLLENFPKEYLSIQKDRRMRIRNIYKQGYPRANGKCVK